MLRELQKLVTDERSNKENLEHELQQSQDQIKALKLGIIYEISRYLKFGYDHVF